ncbi:MAG: carboxypeptidase regulatory-like domain-containing protein [Gemmatimonadales bacterium]|jgi:hypothetical protein
MLRRVCAAALAATLCVTGLIQPAAAQEGTQSQAVVLGRVLDDETGQPIETVEVRFVGEGENLVRVTDGEGAFLFPRVRPGTYEILLTHMAYGTHTDTIRIRSGELLEYEARVAMRPIELEPLRVTVARRSVSPMLLGFYERMSMGGGQ